MEPLVSWGSNSSWLSGLHFLTPDLTLYKVLVGMIPVNLLASSPGALRSPRKGT